MHVFEVLPDPSAPSDPQTTWSPEMVRGGGRYDSGCVWDSLGGG